MKKSSTTTSKVLCLALGISFLMGCDLLGIGPKKHDNSQKQPDVTVSAPASQATPGPLPTNVLVRIGSWTLTTDEFNDRLNILKEQVERNPASVDKNFNINDPATKSNLLEQLIQQQLLVKEAEGSDIVNTKEVKDAIEDFRKTLLVQELASRLTKEVVATEDDARAYYDTNKDKFVTPVTWKVSQIVAADEVTAKNILVQLLQGGDFAQIAQAQSKDAASAPKGGQLEPFLTGRAPFSAMQTAISNLDEGGISGVFKGPEGNYYIVKVDSKKGGTVPAFADVKKDLIYYLTMQKQQNALLSHLKDLANKSDTERNKDLIEQVIGKT